MHFWEPEQTRNKALPWPSQVTSMLCGKPAAEAQWSSATKSRVTCFVCYTHLVSAGMSSGVKHDSEKPRTDLLPPDALIGAAKAFAYGAKKYAAWNYLNGLAWTRVYGALLRHAFAWALGEETDEESKLPHLDHMAACALMLSAMVKRKKGTDDRWVP